MLFVYIRNWCSNRGKEDSGSEHSLDTDNMSLLNVNVPKVDTDVKTIATTVPEKSAANTNVSVDKDKSDKLNKQK